MNSEISESGIDLAWKNVDVGLNQYLGHVFEDICREYVLKHGYREAGR